jgi:hypothetical protein
MLRHFIPSQKAIESALCAALAVVQKKEEYMNVINLYFKEAVLNGD